MLPDYRDVAEALVHKDLRLSFDGNRYCVPARYVGEKLTVKADSSSVTIYDQAKEVVCYARCWERGRTFGAERFQKELYAQMAAAQRSATQQRLIALLGPASEEYLRRLADTDRSLVRQVRELVDLIREYSPEAVAAANFAAWQRATSLRRLRRGTAGAAARYGRWRRAEGDRSRRERADVL